MIYQLSLHVLLACTRNLKFIESDFMYMYIILNPLPLPLLTPPPLKYQYILIIVNLSSKIENIQIDERYPLIYFSDTLCCILKASTGRLELFGYNSFCHSFLFDEAWWQWTILQRIDLVGKYIKNSGLYDLKVEGTGEGLRLLDP